MLWDSTHNHWTGGQAKQVQRGIVDDAIRKQSVYRVNTTHTLWHTAADCEEACIIIAPENVFPPLHMYTKQMVHPLPCITSSSFGMRALVADMLSRITNAWNASCIPV